MTYQEERVCKVSVCEHSIAHPASCSSTSVIYLAQNQRDIDAYEFVAGVCHKIEELAFIVYTQYVYGQPNDQYLEYHNEKSPRCSAA